MAGVGRELAVELVLHEQGKEGLQVEAGPLQRLEQPGLLGLDRGDALLDVGGPRQGEDFANDAQLAAGPGLDALQRPQRAEAQQVSQRLRVAGIVDVLVLHGVDVPAAPLQEEGDRAAAETVLDRLRGESGDVGRVGAAGDALDGMAGEAEDDRQRLTARPVQAEQADLGVHRPDADDVLIRRQRIGVAHVDLAAVLQLEPAVLHDAALAPAAGADLDGRHVLPGLLDRLHGPLLDIRAYDPVAMAGVDEDMRGRDLQLVLESPADVRQEVVLDPADLPDGNGVHGDDRHRRGIVPQHECLGVERVVERRVGVRNLHPGHACLELSRLPNGTSRQSNRQEHQHHRRDPALAAGVVTGRRDGGETVGRFHGIQRRWFRRGFWDRTRMRRITRPTDRRRTLVASADATAARGRRTGPRRGP